MPRRLMSRLYRFACETERKPNGPAKAGHYVRKARPAKAGHHVRKARPAKAGHHVRSAVILSAVIIVMLLGLSRGAFAQPEAAPATTGEARAQEAQPNAERPEAAEAAEGAEHEEG